MPGQPASSIQLLASDALFGGNSWDGKFKILSLEKIMQSKCGQKIPEEYFVETSHGVMCSEFFNFNGQELIVSGCDDGTVQIFNYSANKSKTSVQKPLFKVTKDTSKTTGGDQPVANPLDHPYDIFQETLYEHDQSVVAIEKNFKDPLTFASASRDGTACIWKFIEG